MLSNSKFLPRQDLESHICGERQVEEMSFLKRFDGRPILQNVAISFFLNLIIEILSRRSIAEGLVFISQPLVIPTTRLSSCLPWPSSRFPAPYFAQILISALWLVLGLVNFVLPGFTTLAQLTLSCSCR